MLGRRKNSVGADPHAHVREPRRLRQHARRWPVQVADPAWSPEAFGFVDFQTGLDAV
jgi:hypothetical protein